MKTTTRNVLIGLMAGGAMLMAGNVGTLTQFHPNTPAKSAEVNANFAAVKTAVNGNASDIASNKSAIQTNTTNIALKSPETVLRDQRYGRSILMALFCVKPWTKAARWWCRALPFRQRTKHKTNAN